MSEDRIYWHVSGRRTWHAERPTRALWEVALCGRTNLSRAEQGFETSDRVPASGHLCGSCARVIAAATDIESEG